MCFRIVTHYGACERHPHIGWRYCARRSKCQTDASTMISDQVFHGRDAPCVTCRLHNQVLPDHPEYDPRMLLPVMDEDVRSEQIHSAAGRMDADKFTGWLTLFVQRDAKTRIGHEGGPRSYAEAGELAKYLEVQFYRILCHMRKFNLGDAPDWVQERIRAVEGTSG
ncbi:hypothetical protein B9Z65_2222 [Elsinoe australis]|uniref:Uncharacterized protein n=1 Tax=Elsinoe australis TaxID=40998 RepID=A0A2P7YNG9_9PEZI|nr:hypothetical protein B9Z65_2222 [Elsinoe australis]